MHFILSCIADLGILNESANEIDGNRSRQTANRNTLLWSCDEAWVNQGTSNNRWSVTCLRTVGEEKTQLILTWEIRIRVHIIRQLSSLILLQCHSATVKRLHARLQIAWGIAEVGIEPFFAPRHIFTVRLHVMQRTVLLSQFCPSVRPSVCVSVRLSVTRVDCDKTKWRTAYIFIPHERAITLLIRYQEWLVGDAPFPLKSALKVTHPLRKTPTSTDFRS